MRALPPHIENSVQPNGWWPVDFAGSYFLSQGQILSGPPGPLGFGGLLLLDER